MRYNRRRLNPLQLGRYAEYLFFPKDKFELRENLLEAVVIFNNGSAPRIYLIPSTAWLPADPLLVSHALQDRYRI